ncbi:hypothetical protein H310_10633 [Aphanomyces invadans]|uniref:Cyclic nucleotide-binding domain-containing protein n=1 Tax=Aphanomyces invadans TaxID=157072 RepID=A0A024TRM9_9STRA|nr:hypothetical protein H310_10633 [Aphanomyces invadans]ETV95977.1 hypothetical protein H310_10633 [Aphanomyces invadans]|eukprot:XP_008875288.1 hypothetical protein H310_10633 [Aphanomyces invadans]
MEVCVFTDASDMFWGAVATQGPVEDLSLPLEDQRHQPLAFISARWPIVEKEANAVVESCKRLDYLIVRPGGFRLFTDHRNLVYMFNPSGSNGHLAKYQSDEPQRWALIMSTFPLLSRCGSIPPAPPVPHVHKLVHVVSPLQREDFEWPTAASILAAQTSAIEGGESTPTGVVWNEGESFHMDEKGRIWIPDSAVDLQQRLCVIAHQGPAKFLAQDVDTFVRACLQCLQVDVEALKPITFKDGESIVKQGDRGERFFMIAKGEAAVTKFIDGKERMITHLYAGHYFGELVLIYDDPRTTTDDMSGFVHLHASDTADASATAAALMSWFTFMGAHHHITMAYSSWTNGTIEVVNHLVLRAGKALLNESACRRLAAVTAFTRLPAKTPMSGFVHPKTKDVFVVDWLGEDRRQHMAELKTS